MELRAELEGVDELVATVKEADRRLKTRLQQASLDAARAGVREVQEDHPYTDRTYQLTERAHVESDGEEAEMVWPKDYASFVDGRGYNAERSAGGKFAFTPKAEQRAQAALDRGVEQAIQEFEDTLNR